MLTARLDYNFSENMKWFARLSYDNANEIGPSEQPVEFSQSAERSGVRFSGWIGTGDGL